MYTQWDGGNGEKVMKHKRPLYSLLKWTTFFLGRLTINRNHKYNEFPTQALNN